jgi:hypothetical protein
MEKSLVMSDPPTIELVWLGHEVVGSEPGGREHFFSFRLYTPDYFGIIGRLNDPVPPARQCEWSYIDVGLLIIMPKRWMYKET